MDTLNLGLYGDVRAAATAAMAKAAVARSAVARMERLGVGILMSILGRLTLHGPFLALFKQGPFLGP